MKYIYGQEKRNRNNTKHQGKVKLSVVVLVLLAILGFFYYFRSDILSFFDPVSIVASVGASNLKTTDGRTNILFLGSDKRAGENREGQLTDTILVVSIGKIDKDVVMISVPRDLWVQTSCGYSGRCK